LISTHDYTIKMRFKKETSFVKNFLGNLLSTVTLTLVPAPYTQSHSLETKVFNYNGEIVAQYNHRASVTKWVEALLIVIYPFHTEEAKDRRNLCSYNT